MNFHLFGLIVYACAFLIMERVFKRAIVTPYILPKTGFLMLSVYFFVVTRGSGLDLYFLHLAVPLVLMGVIWFWLAVQQGWR